MNYIERLRIPIESSENIIFYNSKEIMITNGYNRIVIGGRGPYVEFEKHHLITKLLIIPEDQKWRLSSKTTYYLWYDIGGLKLYFQKRVVGYADYKIGKYYISPFDLYVNDKPVIERKK